MEVSDQVKADSRVAAAQGAASGASTGAMIGSAVPVIGTLIGAGAGALIGGLAMYFTTRSQGKQAQEDLQQLEDEQNRLAKRQATEQRQLSRELASSKKKTPTSQPPSSIMMEAVGGGSGYDAWHNRTFS